MDFFGQVGGMVDDVWNFFTGGHLYANGNLTAAEQAQLTQTGTVLNGGGVGGSTPTTKPGVFQSLGITPLEEFGIFAVLILILGIIALAYWKK